MNDPNIFFTGVSGTLDAKATAFRITGTSVSEEENAVLHWHIYIVEDENLSTIFDLTPGGPDGRIGVLIVKGIWRASDFSSKADIVFSAVKQVTCRDVLHTVQSLGRTRYRYTDDGSRCRYWCRTVLQDLVNEGYVAGDAVTAFDAFRIPLYIPFPPAKVHSIRITLFLLSLFPVFLTSSP